MTPRNCPICNVPLRPEAYEGLRIQRCPQCQGHLLEQARFDAIRRIPQKSLPKLEAEARADFTGDTAAPLRCPRCRVTLIKRPLAVPGFDLHMDVCFDCSLVWLDGGELAMAQLVYQASPKFRDTQEMKRRAEALDADPERKAAFDEAVARLPVRPDPFQEGLSEAFRDAVCRILTEPRSLPPRL
jgi:Zn-finger nucleic acid-binding protein